MSAPVGRPRKYTDNRIQMQFRFTRKLRQRIRRVAKQRGVSGNLIVERGVEEYLDKLEREELLASVI